MFNLLLTFFVGALFIGLALMLRPANPCPKGQVASYSMIGKMTIVHCNDPASPVQIKAK